MKIVSVSSRQPKPWDWRWLWISWVLLITGVGSTVTTVRAQPPAPTQRVNVPYFNGQIPLAETAIFWFGQVDSTSNYADVRVGYNNDEVVIHLTAFDRWLWYDATPPLDNLTAWDAATLYLNLSGNEGDLPDSHSYRFVAQLNHWQPRADYQAVYQGNGAGWTAASIPFTSVSGWRGDGLNDGAEARGWTMTFHIPFTSLGLASPPPAGSLWGLALTLHDRDDAGGSPIPIRQWPETVDVQRPATWGQLHFGLPTYQPPQATPGQITTIRHGLNGVAVVDAHVGGHSDCGDAFDPYFFSGWGDANYAHYEQINIQNQLDVADWPCFSKYYVTFPLETIPANKAVISATLTLYQFGNAGDPGQAYPSLLQVLTVAEAWDEATLTWNNAPLAVENVASAWADPLDAFPDWPGVPTTWDVSGAVAAALDAGQPLRLAIYEADGAQHSGKYFVSSDTGDWNAGGRPTLQVSWGDPSFSISTTPATQMMATGDSANYTIRIEHNSNFTGTVTLQLGDSPASDLKVSLASPTSFDPPGGQTTLTLTDTHDPSVSAGFWYTIPITASSGEISKVTSVSLLVNGQQVYLPLLLK